MRLRLNDYYMVKTDNRGLMMGEFIDDMYINDSITLYKFIFQDGTYGVVYGDEIKDRVVRQPTKLDRVLYGLN